MEALRAQRLRLSLRAILSCIVVFLVTPIQASNFAGGTGEPNDPYQIATAEQLISIGSDPNLLDKHFILINDIDLDPNLPGGQVFDRAVIAPDMNDTDPHFQGTSFNGSLDGQDYTIANLTIDSDSEYAGLFGLIGEEGIIKQVHLVGGSVRGTAIYVPSGGGRCGTGGLGGENRGLIQDCHGNVTLTGLDFVGGLVGENQGMISGSSSVGSVGGRDQVGGLVGLNFYGRVTNSYSTGLVNGTYSVGGLVGDNSGTVSNSYSMSSVRGSGGVGGLVGANDGSVSNSFGTGSVDGTYSVGGLVGYNYDGTVTNSYSTGSVHGERSFEGLVGANSYGTVLNSFWDIETSGVLESDNGIGLTTSQMQKLDTFVDAGWDFLGERKNGTGEIWLLPTEGRYPVLSILNGYIPPLLEGAGTPGDPYIVATPEDLGTVWYRPTAYYRLVENIDLFGIVWSTAVVPFFKGGFEGEGHSILNLKIYGKDHLGLFGHIVGEAEVSNLGLVDVNIVGGGRFVGSLVGVNAGIISNSYSTGSIFSVNDYVGGLVGYNSDESIISSCYNMCLVSGRANVGGLVGENVYGSISNSFSMGSIKGGLSHIGGLAGSSFFGTISNSYNKGSVVGMELVGGLVGFHSYGSISNSYNTGFVVGMDDVGGLVAYNRGTVAESFWDIETSGQLESAGGIGLTTAEMQDINTYLDAGWDFDMIWSICEGVDYPHLQWEQRSCSED